MTKEQIKAIIKQYADKGKTQYRECCDDNESASLINYWDGYKDCANGLLRELKDMQEEPEYLEEETTYCAFSTSRYTDKERKALCKGCEEECELKPTTSVWHDTKEEPPMDSNVVFRYIDAVSSCRYCGQTMKDVIAWAYFKELKEL